MLIFANGDSQTAATNPSGTSFYNYDVAWPRWIAEDLKADYINIAEPGSGNAQISRSTIIKVGSLIKEVNPKDVLVTILWAGWKRYEFWSDVDHKHQSLSLKSKWKPRQEIVDYVEKRSIVESDNYTHYKHLFYMYNTAVALESYGVNYVFCNANRSMLTPEDFIDSPELCYEYQQLYNLYGNRKNKHVGFHNEQETFQEYVRDFPTVVDGPYWGEDAHQAYAKLVQKDLTLIK